MRLLTTLLGTALSLAPIAASANGNVYVSRFWHNHQPLYWPEWNKNGAQTQRGQYAWDSIVLKPSQNYGGISPSQHPENNLTDIFGLDDRKNAYQQGPRNSLANVDSRGGFGVSYSGSLIDNVRQLGGGGHLGYGGNWNAGFREARGWKTPGGSTRMDMLGFTYHHSLGPLLPKSVFRKEIQAFKQAWWKAWGGNSDLSDHSKGFFPTEMAYSRHLVDVLVDEGFEWTLVPSHHISRTSPSYNNKANPEGSYGIYSSPPNKADQLSQRFDNDSQWWYGMPNPGNAAWNVAPFAYQLHRVKYVNPENGAEKKMYAVPSDDVLSYRYGYANEGIGKIVDHIAPHASVPVIVIPATDGDNAWGGGSSSWFEATPQLFGESANRGYKPAAPQDFVNAAKAGITTDTHIEDGAWIFPEMCYGSPNFLKWIEPPVATVANRGKTTHPGTQVDMETPGFALKFFSYAPLMAGANWLETAEQVLAEENGGNDMVNEWKIASPYDWDGTWTSPNDVELAWHIYLKGLDSGFNYYGGLGNDDEVKPALATKNAIDKLQSFMTPARKAKDKTPPTVLKPQRFPYNPGWYTFGWFNNEPHINNSNFLKKMPSWFYIWTHAYDINGIPEGGVKLKVRIDNDGNNPLNTNQNETYPGGSEVGQWVTVNMTKRVLPKTRTALNAAAANGQIDYFVFDPAFWANPVIADYYFAKIDDTSLPNFRDKLLDYYIEATDALGNVHKSEIQHVWVANDGQTPSSGVSFSANPSDCEPITVTYTASNGPLEGLSPVTMQISFNGGTTWTPYQMNSSSANVWTYTISAPNNAPSATVYFESGSTIDSRNGQNWTISIRDCEAPSGPVWTVPFTPVAGQPVTVYYNPAGRALASATAVNIHHGFNENITANWTPVPGVAMTKDGSNWKFTYTVPANATIVRYVFNNNANTWDNNGGNNWNIDVNSQPPPTEPPLAPTGLSATATSSTTVSLSWTASTNATGYKVFRNSTQIAAPTDRNYVDTGLTAETLYSYSVRAFNTNGDSPDSSSVSVTTPFAPVGGSSILLLEPAPLTETSSGNVTFRGRAGGNFTNGLVWINNATGQNGTIAFPGGSVANGWEWTASIPLAEGSNSITFTGLIESSGNLTLTDSPMNYTSFSANTTAGQGFGVWYFDHSAANAGSFLADNISTGNTTMNVGTTKGFGLWANSGGRAALTRSFNTPMKSGDNFNVKFDNNWINDGSEVGMELRSAQGTVCFRFFFIGGQANYRVVDSQGNRTTQIAYTANGLDLNLSLGYGTAYTLNTGAGLITGNLASSEPITWIEFFNNNAGPTVDRNLYIGAMTHTIATSGNQTISQDRIVTRTPPPPPVINAESLAGYVGTAFSYSINATNLPFLFGNSTALPDGLTLNATTGLISGVPTTAGNFTTDINATNSGGTGNATLSFEIARGTPIIYSSPTASYLLPGMPVYYTMLTGGSASVPGIFDFVDPFAIVYSTISHPLIFTPTDVVNYTTANASVTVPVNFGGGGGLVPIVNSSTVNGTVGAQINYSISASNFPTSFSVDPATPLPPGLTFNPSAGFISGIPTAGGEFAVSVTAINNSGFGTGTITFRIDGGLSPFDLWTGGNVTLTSDILKRYAIGAGSFDGTTPSEAVQVSTTGGNLTLTAIIRTNDPALTITGEHTQSLTGNWSTLGNGTISGIDQTGVPANHERRIFSIPAGGDTKKFLRLRAIYNQEN